MDVEAVDLILVQERADQPCPSHDPDVLPRGGTEEPDEGPGRVPDELDPRRRGSWRAPGKDIAPDPGVEREPASAELQTHLVGLPSQEDRVDRLQEGPHPVVALRPGTLEPADVPVRAGDVPVRGRGEVGDGSSWSPHPLSHIPASNAPGKCSMTAPGP